MPRHVLLALGLLLAACGSSSSDPSTGEDDLTKRAKPTSSVVSMCQEEGGGSQRSVTVSKAGDALSATFKDFDVSPANHDTYECIEWTRGDGSLRYRCYQTNAEKPFYQISLERTAQGKPAAYFDLVNYRDEDGDTYLHMFDCIDDARLGAAFSKRP